MKHQDLPLQQQTRWVINPSDRMLVISSRQEVVENEWYV